MRALAADGGQRRVYATLACIGLLAAWAAWLCLAEVVVRATSDVGRLEVDRAVLPIHAEVAGVVAVSHLRVGRAVRKGDVLLVLDAQRERLRLREEQARLQALRGELDPLREQRAAEARALRESDAARAAAVGEARAQREEAQAAAEFAALQLQMMVRLNGQKLVADVEVAGARAEAAKRRALVEARELALGRLEREQRAEIDGRRSRLERLRYDLAGVEGRLAATRVNVAGLAHEIERRRVRAAIDGVVGEISPELGVGVHVQAGERLGAIVPRGPVRAVAFFGTSEAAGRIRVRQPARVRLKGFPWTQYGGLRALVSSVANEPRGETLRVELSLRPEPGSRLPVEHGLPITVEVEVERASLAALVLRAAGRQLGKVSAAPQRSGYTP